MKIGLQDIDRLKVGETDVSSVYLGSEQVWKKPNIFRGTATPNTTFTIKINGSDVSVTSDSDGKWRYATTTTITKLDEFALDNTFIKTAVFDLVRHYGSYRSMFENCTSITEFTGYGMDCNNFSFLKSMFSGCVNLKMVYLDNSSEWSYYYNTTIYYTFYHCYNLVRITYLPIMSCLATDWSVFNGAAKLSSIDAVPNISKGANFSSCPLTLASAITILSALQPVSTSQTITFSSYTATLINASEEALSLVAEAVSNGWTIAGI